MRPESQPPEGLAHVRFFIDENLAGLYVALHRVRDDIVTPTHPPIRGLVPRDDPDWIPDVAARGWVVITNDKHIRTRPTEAPKAVEAGLRVAHLDAGDKPRMFDYLRLLLTHWNEVERLHDASGPTWLQLDVARVHPYERPYEPGKPHRLPADPREDRIRAAKQQRKRPSGAQRRRRARSTDPDQSALELPAGGDVPAAPDEDREKQVDNRGSPSAAVDG